MNNIRLTPFKECINKELYEMYQDILFKEIGSINKLKDIELEEFYNICKKYIKAEEFINEQLNTTTLRYILYNNKLPIGEVGIRNTINDYWKNQGSQIHYKIRLSEII